MQCRYHVPFDIPADKASAEDIQPCQEQIRLLAARTSGASASSTQASTVHCVGMQVVSEDGVSGAAAATHRLQEICPLKLLNTVFRLLRQRALTVQLQVSHSGDGTRFSSVLGRGGVVDCITTFQGTCQVL